LDAGPPEAIVVDLAEMQDRRRQRRSDAAPAPAAPAELAPVIVLTPRPQGAGGGAARGDVVAHAAPARAGPEAEPAVIAAPPSPTRNADPEASGAPARAGPEPVPEADSAPEPGASPDARAPPAGVALEPAPAAGAAPESSVAAPEAMEGASDEAPALEAVEGASDEAPGPAAAGGEAAPQPAADEAAAQPLVIRNPEDEPGFQAMKRRTQRAATRTKTHQPALEGAATAQGAAVAPDNDLESQAAGAQVEVMGEQEPGVFDAQAFIAAVKRAVEAATPSTLEDADEFKESGRVGEATAEVQGLVKGGKESSEHDIQTATVALPDTAKAVPKPEADMVNDESGPALPGVGASAAMPGPRPQEQTDLSAGPAKVDAEMATANVTDEQIARSNEPDFGAALDARQKARDHAATAPAEYRAEEETILGTGSELAAGAAAAQLEGMHGARSGALGQVLGEKEDCKSAHEGEHARVASEIEAMYDATKAAVQAILDGLDTKVDDEFTRGEEAARTRFENYVDDSMRAYKRARYDRIGGGLLWLKDKIAGMPDEVNEFYEQGRADYLEAMDAVIEGIANTVGAELTAARARIAEGRTEVRAYVESLDENLRAVGETAAGKLEDRFDELTSEVDSKQDELVEAVARRYVESRDALDARIEELQAANKGLVAAALDAVIGVIKTILALGEMLLRVLAKAAEVVGDIISDPIGFLTNLIDGVMGGLERFVQRIEIHLQNALVEWLFGTLGGAGITVPKQLDGAGVLDLVTQVIGLTYANIRARVARVLGEPVVAQMEQTVDVFKTLATEGVGGLWEFVEDKVGDIEETVLGKIKEYVIERVIKGGIAWIIGLLTPVGAFIKACKAIYQIVMFIVERAKQIMEFVNSILDSISAIAKGNIGAAVEKVEGALAKGLTLAIGFLASLLGIGNLSEKVKSIVAAVRRPIEKAIDFVVMGAARAFKRTLGGAARWAKGKVEAGKEWAAGKVEAGKEWAKGKPVPAGDHTTGEQPEPRKSADKEADVRSQARAAVLAELKGEHTIEEAMPIVAGIEERLRPAGLQRLRIAPPAEDGSAKILVEASPVLPLARLIPRGTVPKGRTVKVVAEIELSANAESMSRRLPSTDRGGLAQGGGVLAQPSDRPNIVRVAGWNTSNINTHDNASHAEHQLSQFIETEYVGDLRLMPLIHRLQVNVLFYSPCATCSGELAKLLSRIATDRKRPFERGEAILAWRDHYAGFKGGINATTWQSINALDSAGWSLKAPASGRPQTDEQSGRESSGFHEAQLKIEAL